MRIVHEISFFAEVYVVGGYRYMIALSENGQRYYVSRYTLFADGSAALTPVGNAATEDAAMQLAQENSQSIWYRGSN